MDKMILLKSRINGFKRIEAALVVTSELGRLVFWNIHRVPYIQGINMHSLFFNLTRYNVTILANRILLFTLTHSDYSCILLQGFNWGFSYMYARFKILFILVFFSGYSFICCHFDERRAHLGGGRSKRRTTSCFRWHERGGASVAHWEVLPQVSHCCTSSLAPHALYKILCLILLLNLYIHVMHVSIHRFSANFRLANGNSTV